MSPSLNSPRQLRVLAVLLVLAGVVVAGCGVGAWMVSGCCGSREPSQDGYLLLGALGAGGLWVAAHLLRARARRVSG